MLCDLAFVAPTSVLPLVVQRFREALDSAVAPHQLVTSITTLAMCVRPMLLAGWSLPEEGCAQVGLPLRLLAGRYPAVQQALLLELKASVVLGYLPQRGCRIDA